MEFLNNLLNRPVAKAKKAIKDATAKRTKPNPERESPQEDENLYKTPEDKDDDLYKTPEDNEQDMVVNQVLVDINSRTRRRKKSKSPASPLMPPRQIQEDIHRKKTALTAKTSKSPKYNFTQKIAHTKNKQMWKNVYMYATRTISLGKNRELIYKHFEYFRNFNNIVTEEIKRIGTVSDAQNGFVIEIPFQKDSVKAYTILKSSASPSNDNLMYEYIAGTQFINQQNKYFPCFMETYMLAQYNSIDAYQQVKDVFASDMNSKKKGKTRLSALASLFKKSQTTQKTSQLSNPLSSFLSLVPESDMNWKYACENNIRFCILSQYFDNVTNIVQLYEPEHHDRTFFDIPQFLYQLYFTLDRLRHVFTHYDLNQGNVLFYKPFPGKEFVQMNYHLQNGNVISFPTERIVKIIDYGRCFFRNESTDSYTVLNTIYNTPECIDKVKNTVKPSLKYVRRYTEKSREYNLERNRPATFGNPSHDLRFVFHLTNFIENAQIQFPEPKWENDEFSPAKSSYHPPISIHPPHNDNDYDEKEEEDDEEDEDDEKDKVNGPTVKISTVSDMRYFLEAPPFKYKNHDPYTSGWLTTYNEKLYLKKDGWKCRGVIHVYEEQNRPYVFTEITD